MRRDGNPAAVDEDHGVRIAVDGDVNLDAGPGAAQPREYEEQTAAATTDQGVGP